MHGESEVDSIGSFLMRPLVRLLCIDEVSVISIYAVYVESSKKKPITAVGIGLWPLCLRVLMKNNTKPNK